MRTRQSKLSEDADESHHAEKTNEDDGETMKVDVIPEESATGALGDSPQNHSILKTPETLNPEDVSCPSNDSTSSKETSNVSLTNKIEGASDTLEIETSAIEESGVSEMEQTLDDSVVTLSLVCSEQSTSAEEVTADTVEACSNSLTVPAVPDQSHGNITETKESSSSSKKELAGTIKTDTQTTDAPPADVVKTDASTTSEGKTDGNIVSGTEKGDKLPISSNNEITESPEVPNPQLTQIKQQVLRGEYRLFCVEYCKSKNISIPSLRRFKEMYHKLRVKDKLSKENLKIALDKFGKEIDNKVGTSKTENKVGTSKPENKVRTSKPENKRSSALLDVVEGEILPSIVKTLSEMTEEERVAFFDEFNALKAEMTPIAIKHCHTIKSPFPKKDFNLICRDLFAVGMLDEENVKLAVEMAFKEKCKGRLNDFQLNLVLKHYCIDKGISSSPGRLKIDILPILPKKFLNLKHYWALMYRLRRTNLFSDAELANPEAAAKKVKRKNGRNSSTAPSTAQKSAKAHDKTAKPSTSLAVSTRRRERIRGRVRSKVVQAKDHSNSNKGHSTVKSLTRPDTKQKESTSSKTLEPLLEAKGFSKTDKRRIEGPGSSKIRPDIKRRKNLEAEGSSGSYEGRIDETENASYQNPWSSFVNGSNLSKTTNNEGSIQHMLLETKQWIAEKSRLLGGLKTQGNLSESLSKRLGWTKKQDQQESNLNLKGELDRFSKTLSRRQRRFKQHQLLIEQEKLKLPPPLLSTETMCFSQSHIPEPNFSTQNVVKANFTSHSNIGVPGTSNSLWPVESSRLENIGHDRTEISGKHSWNSGFEEHSENQGYGSRFLDREYNHLENVGRNRAEIPNDYSRNLDFDEHPRNQEYDRDFLGDEQRYDNPVAGTSRQDWSEGERFSSSWKNNKWDDLERGMNLREPVEKSLPVAPRPEMSAVSSKLVFRNNQELSTRKREDDDWRLARNVPPQKKSRYVEDVEPKTSKSVYLQHAVNDFEDWINKKKTEKFSEPVYSSTSSSGHFGRVSPQTSSRDLSWASTPMFGGESRKAAVMENPPFIVPGKICKVAIVHEDYPFAKVTNEEAELIRYELWKRIGVQSGVGPRFSDTYEERGAVVFECEDQVTVSWIWVNARTITPWSKARLRPTSWEKPPNEISIVIPRMLQSLTPEDLCQRLKNQNPGLSTKNWKFKLADETAPKGLELVFYVDDVSMEKLKSCDLRPYLGFSRVKVHVIHE